MSGTTTYDIDFSYQGVVTANGSFSFNTALLGQTISPSELTSFTLTFDPSLYNEPSESFSSLVVGSVYLADQAPYPYFQFNSATDTLAPYQSTMVALQGGTTAVPPGDPDLEFSLVENQPAYQGIVVSHILAHGTYFEYGSFDTVTITQEPACFVSGANILTQRGDVAVEALAVGDMVATANGEFKPVRWIGRRSYAGRFLAANPGVQPILFRGGSLGGGLPRRDLLVSPEHAMLIDGKLIPAKALANGAAIVQQRGLGRVDYVHIELDSHDVVLAEGAAAESFRDDGSRGAFHNAPGHLARNSGPMERCAPWLDSGAELEAIRMRLAGIALAA